MLVAVLLESEFLYRLEFGGDWKDEHDRRMLTPREAAYAISYALGDRGPDESLMQAAERAGYRPTRTTHARFAACWLTKTTTAGRSIRRSTANTFSPTSPRTPELYGSSVSSSATRRDQGVQGRDSDRRDLPQSRPGHPGHSWLADPRGRPHRHLARRTR